MKIKYLILLFLLSFFSENVFSQNIDTSHIYIIDSIKIIGNNKTKVDYIIRECDIQKSIVYNANDLLESITKTENNIYNTSLFNYVEIQNESLYTINDTLHINIIIELIERWYFWPSPILNSSSRNINEWWEHKRLDKINVGAVLLWNNFSGRGDKLYTLLQFGYNNAVELKWMSPYINNKKTIRLLFLSSYTSKREIKIGLDSNKIIFSETDNYAIKNLSFSTELLYKKNLYNSHLISLKFDRYVLDESLVNQMPYLAVNSKSKFNYFSLNYLFKRDLRDYKDYPLKGYYIDFNYSQNGVGISEDSPLHTNIETNFRKYWKLNKKLYFASGLSLHYANENKSLYSTDRGLGYLRYYVRGFENYVVDGQNFILFKSNVKYALLPKKYINLPLIDTEKFKKSFLSIYLSLNYDLAYIDDKLYPKGNYLANQILMGGGLGIDFVSFYDLVMRIEYSYNNIFEHGLYVHFMTSI